MTPERAEMEEHLKKHCVSFLRKHGFKGSFPNLYRDIDGFVSLINFQFSLSGGRFCVNVSYADKARENVYFRKETEPKKLKVWQTTVRIRLSSGYYVRNQWFSFGKTSYGAFRGRPLAPSKIVEEVNRLIAAVALPWWDEKACGS